MQKEDPREARGTVAVLQSDGSLTGAAVQLLHTVTGVDRALLRAARIRPSRTNWLHAPWYSYRRGGAITIGRTIWFSGIWFAPDGYADGSLASTRKWLLHLAHEAGHLPQATRFGRSPAGKMRYVAAFAWQYTARALLFRRPVHDGSPLEREADMGRQVLLQLLGDAQEPHPLVVAVHHRAEGAVLEWCDGHNGQIGGLREKYRSRHLA